MNSALAPTAKNIHPVFNALSQIDRLKLRSAAAIAALAGIARGETEHRAWKFPFYLGLVTFIALPIPVPGSNAIPLALAFGWYRLGLTPQARWAQGEISKKFNHAALVEDYRDCLHETPQNSGIFKVKTWPLARKANKAAYQDMVAAKRIFTGRVRDFFLS